MKKIILLFIFPTLLCSFAGSAKNPVLYFLNEKNGLSDNQVNCFLQDSRGIMWMGTSYGLNSYDGSQCRVYNKNSKQLCDDVITDLAENDRQQLWIATAHGLGMCDLSTGEFQSYFYHSNDNLLNTFSSVVCYGDSLLLGTEKGIVIFNTVQQKFITQVQPVSTGGANHITKIYQDRERRIWLCTFNGLWKYHVQTGRSTLINDAAGTVNPLQNELINDIIEMPDHTFWVGTWSKGLFSFSENNWQPKSWLNVPGSHTNVTTLAVLQNQQSSELWLSNQLSTLRTTEKKFELHHFFGDSPYPDISVLKLYTDRHNMLWIATNAGVYMYDPSVQFFSTHLLTNGIPYTTQGVSLLSHPEGYWMGGENFNSLVFCDLQHNLKKNYSALLHDHVAVLNIMQDHQGRLWLSTNKGIYISDVAITKFIHWSEQSAGTTRLPRNFINRVFHTSDSSVWIFPWRMGIWKMNKELGFEPLQNKRHDTLLQNSNIARAVEDTLGHIWLADYDHGFHRYDKETGEVTTLIRDVCFSNIYLLQNKIWLASSHALIETDITNSTIRYYAFPAGKDKFTFNFIPDQHDGIWIATKTGLLYFNVRSKSYRCFTVSDGLYSNFLDVSMAQLSNGNIIMAGSTFVTTFDPEKLNAADPAPALLLREIRSNRHFIKISDHSFQTAWNENSLNFSWAFLNYKNPLGNEYFYKMDGVDADWISAGNSGKAFYNNLQPGYYTFHYKARSSDYRVENKQAISFRVKPPYWQTWWFRIMMLLCTGYIFYRFIRYISQKNLKEKIMLLEKKQAIERERNRISRDMHDELGSGLTKIAILSEVMKKAPDEKNAVIDKISTTARSLVSNLDEMVWSLNPHNDTLQQLIAYVSEHGVQFFENTEIDFDQVIPDEIPQHILQEEKRRALFLCIKEFFNNTLKHSKARKVVITWSFSDQYFNCILTDDGVGFDIHNADKSRSGLRNMESRMREIKAGFELQSDEAGTKLRIECPF